MPNKLENTFYIFNLNKLKRTKIAGMIEDIRFKNLKEIMRSSGNRYIIRTLFVDIIIFMGAYFPTILLYSFIRNGDPFKAVHLLVYGGDLLIDVLSFGISSALILLMYKLYITNAMRKQGYSTEMILKPSNFSALSISLDNQNTIFADLDDKKVFQINKISAIMDLDRRANKISFRNGIVLFLIASFLMCAVAIVVFAGKLTSLDVSATSVIDRLKSEQKENDEKLIRIDKSTADLNSLKDIKHQILTKINALDKNYSVEDVPKIKSLISELRNYETSLDGNPRFAELPIAVNTETAKVMKEKIIAQDKVLTSMLNDSLLAKAKADDAAIDWRYIIATAITRIGVILIIVFLVQILLGLYRYNTRLSTYYSSIKDVLKLYNGNTTEIAALISSFGPPKVNFDKDPKHPLEDVIKILNQKINDGSAAANTAGGVGKPS